MSFSDAPMVPISLILFISGLIALILLLHISIYAFVYTPLLIGKAGYSAADVDSMDLPSAFENAFVHSVIEHVCYGFCQGESICYNCCLCNYVSYPVTVGNTVCKPHACRCDVYYPVVKCP